jgi:hypothetical protein
VCSRVCVREKGGGGERHSNFAKSPPPTPSTELLICSSSHLLIYSSSHLQLPPRHLLGGRDQPRPAQGPLPQSRRLSESAAAAAGPPPAPLSESRFGSFGRSARPARPLPPAVSAPSPHTVPPHPSSQSVSSVFIPSPPSTSPLIPSLQHTHTHLHFLSHTTHARSGPVDRSRICAAVTIAGGLARVRE